MKNKKIIFTGGGTAGHVIPNLALIKKFQEQNWNVEYIGSQAGIEKEIIAKINIPYHTIATGKLRRYFSLQNFIDPVKIFLGTIQAIVLIHRVKPNVVFSKGGFVAFPIVFAAWLARVPIIIHESDLTIGLANRLCLPFAKKICSTFPPTTQQIKDKNKVALTGTPIREGFLNGNANQGRQLCGFINNKKVILAFGGSLGADIINKNIRKILPKILNDFNVVHICGPGRVDDSCKHAGYKQFEYLHEQFVHILAAADLVISRAGANSVYELIMAKKPNILIPLAAKSSRGDQLLNAQYCVENGYSELILQEHLAPEVLLEKVYILEKNSDKIIKNMQEFKSLDSVEIIYSLIIAEV